MDSSTVLVEGPLAKESSCTSGAVEVESWGYGRRSRKVWMGGCHVGLPGLLETELRTATTTKEKFGDNRVLDQGFSIDGLGVSFYQVCVVADEVNVIPETALAHHITPAARNVVHHGIHMLIQSTTVLIIQVTHRATKWSPRRYRG